MLAAQAGDRLAFGQLVERYERAVYNTALRRLGNHAEAQELAQEVFVQALRKLPQLREPAAFGGWLRAITTRMAINRVTRGGHVTAAEPEMLEATCVETETPLERALTHERNGQVRAGLGRLGRVGPGDAGGLLREGPVAGRDERHVRLAGRHDQAAAARRPQAPGQGAGGPGPGVRARRAARVVVVP